MKELINYCPVDGYPTDLPRMQEEIKQFLVETELDGIELFLYGNIPVINSYKKITTGVHLKYWPYWLEFWRGNNEQAISIWGTQEKVREYYFGAQTQSEWLEAIKENIKLALREEPEYLVWHVADSDNEEALTYNFKHTDEEVVTAAAEVFNAVSEVIPEDVTVLFENLWWPGLTLLDKNIVEKFFSLVKRENVGVMLDTGHLINTNRLVRNEDEALAYICEVISGLGNLKNKIKGIHLNYSLSGIYVESFLRQPMNIRKNTNSTIMPHIIKIDQHKPWQKVNLNILLDSLDIKYVVHELFYSNFNELAELLQKQKSCLKK